MRAVRPVKKYTWRVLRVCFTEEETRAPRDVSVPMYDEDKNKRINKQTHDRTYGRCCVLSVSSYTRRDEEHEGGKKKKRKKKD